MHCYMINEIDISEIRYGMIDQSERRGMNARRQGNAKDPFQFLSSVIMILSQGDPSFMYNSPITKDASASAFQIISFLLLDEKMARLTNLIPDENGEDRKKEALWQSILEFINCNPNHFIIFGDFNVVRNESERIGSLFNSSSASAFNQFIQEGKLWDVPLRGHSFTRISGRGDKLSKLDRFLISEDSAPFFQNFSALVLDSLISDHRPIVLKHSTSDFGPTPFKFYNSWLLDNKFLDLVSQFWEKHIAEVGSNPIIEFKNKMKALKPIIREWSKNLIDSKLSEKNELINKIKEFDDNIEKGIGGQPIDSLRASWLANLHDIESKENLDASQKAKIKWGVKA
ncbi:RNA-directed DNA polymerase, eukaryota, reverse transcriptase zinc-binding domain protein, partial [Tanacetum coccineum]